MSDFAGSTLEACDDIKLEPGELLVIALSLRPLDLAVKIGL